MKLYIDGLAILASFISGGVQFYLFMVSPDSNFMLESVWLFNKVIFLSGEAILTSIVCTHILLISVIALREQIINYFGKVFYLVLKIIVVLISGGTVLGVFLMLKGLWANPLTVMDLKFLGMKVKVLWTESMCLEKLMEMKKQFNLNISAEQMLEITKAVSEGKKTLLEALESFVLMDKQNMVENVSTGGFWYSVGMGLVVVGGIIVVGLVCTHCLHIYEKEIPFVLRPFEKFLEVFSWTSKETDTVVSSIGVEEVQKRLEESVEELNVKIEMLGKEFGNIEKAIPQELVDLQNFTTDLNERLGSLKVNLEQVTLEVGSNFVSKKELSEVSNTFNMELSELNKAFVDMNELVKKVGEESATKITLESDKFLAGVKALYEKLENLRMDYTKLKGIVKEYGGGINRHTHLLDNLGAKVSEHTSDLESVKKVVEKLGETSL